MPIVKLDDVLRSSSFCFHDADNRAAALAFNFNAFANQPCATLFLSLLG